MSGIIDCEMHIGDEVFVHGYIDEIRNDVVIIRNEGGYFGTVPSEIKLKTEPQTDYRTKAIKDLQEYYGIKQEPTLSEMFKDEPQTLDMFALDMAIAKCKVRHNNCKNCDKKCVWRNGINNE